MAFSSSVSFSALPAFLPKIINDMGFTAVNSQGLTAVPYLISVFATIATSWYSDNIQQRGYTVAITALIAAIGYTLLAACERVVIRYIGVVFAASGLFSSAAIIFPWLTSELALSLPIT